MSRAATEALDVPPEPDEPIRAAMAWRFGPETGAPFWLERAKSLPFDPLTDAKTHDDLGLFPNVTAELRDTYAEHLIDQAAFVLRTHGIGVLTITPPLLERVARRDDLAELVNEKVRAIRWGGTQLDPDSRHLYRTGVFPDTVLCGNYGSAMILGFADEHPGLPDDAGCVFDPYSPYVTFAVVDPETPRPVGYGDRGRVLVHHVSKSFFLPDNLERDVATRIEPLVGQAEDAVADIAPVATFENETVIEGVY